MNQPPLGRGLGSLIPQRPPTTTDSGKPKPPPRITTEAPRPTPVAEPAPAKARQGLFEIPIQLIDANPHQPRHQFTADALDDLVQSIRQHGIIQPLVVTRTGERYQLIAGERRLRAAKVVGLQAVPAVVRDSQELEQLEIAIVENVQRQDLNPVEEAYAYQQLADEFALTQDQIAQKVGKSRASIANAIRLLTLPKEMLQALREGRISASHGKILLSAVTPAERQELFNQITKQQLPVRAAGSLGRQTTVRRYSRRNVDPLTLADEDQLRTHFGTKVKITKRDHRGSVSFEFYSDEDYRHLLDRLQQS